MNKKIYNLVDDLLHQEIARLPDELQKLLEEVPVMLDDEPDDNLLRNLDADRDCLCGLYTGVPLTHRSVEFLSRLPDKIQLFRRGIVLAASDSSGRISEKRLRKQVRITLLHEIGHHFGLEEKALRKLGY